ncbi:DUF4232 domain-containing protein [Mycolicibacterium bacteremicum]|uniref:DUF4232 domain-containing protein n=1 Tax=Mycolicibacterium bacteremicum TaxID=564198 RepID=A0A1W9YPG6_MYCBA|nr:DUF4232 domain-containing protein [Mycolicibacterium bacteremicum]MCV7432266.1 DUF4232 domain-containing protein [Mycolicibacterium bacteremicum]ORA01690.1 hypothetical protein BST17_27265 [Mycolicibacterium bacteremicum]
MKIAMSSLPIAVAVLLAGCASEPAARPEPAAPVTITVTAPPAAVPEPVQPEPVQPEPVEPEPVDRVSVPGPCADTDLVVSNRPLESQGSEYRLVLQFENVTSKACTLQGYPGADIVDADLPVLHVERRPQLAAPLLTLQPGEIAVADLQASDVIRETGAPCGRWGQVVVIAPNTHQERHLDVGVPMCSALAARSPEIRS